MIALLRTPDSGIVKSSKEHYKMFPKGHSVDHSTQLEQNHDTRIYAATDGQTERLA